MTMTKEAIVADYKQAKDKKKQVQILADLNNCKKDDIIQILKDGGVNHRELPRASRKPDGDPIDNPPPGKNISKEPTAEPKEGEMNDLEKAMSEVITELRGENDNLKGTITDLEDRIGGYQITVQNLSGNLEEAQDRVRQLEDELADTKSALESTESQLDSELANARGYVEHAAETESKLRSTIDKLNEEIRELKEKTEKQDRIIDRMAEAISDHNAQSTEDQQERRRTSEIMMSLIEKFVLS